MGMVRDLEQYFDQYGVDAHNKMAKKQLMYGLLNPTERAIYNSFSVLCKKYKNDPDFAMIFKQSMASAMMQKVA